MCPPGVAAPWHLGDGRIRGVPALGERCRERGPANAAAASASGGARRSSWRGSLGGVVQLWCGTSLERLDIDAILGPKILQADGRMGFMDEAADWFHLDSADQKLLAYKAAKQNRQMAKTVKEMAARAEEDAWERAASESPATRTRMRCELETKRAAVQWTPIGLETVSEGHDKFAPGMIYGLPFPWSEETLVQLGPAWLTQAFHACRSMPKSNRVTKVVVDAAKITAGNNSGKFLFEVEYAQPDPSLHTRLFAKVPFPMTAATKSDRFSSSVYKQPMDLMEINSYRLFESFFPTKIPRFYYGDISNETSNFILITERVAFAELDGTGRRSLAPFEVEGPYEKCKDFQLRERDAEYYSQLMRVSARIAAAHKTGRFGSEELLASSGLSRPRAGSDWRAWGGNPAAATGLPPQDLRQKLAMAVDFVSSTARPLYPGYVREERFQRKFMSTMMTRAAYHAEIDFWKHSHPDYVALGHQNLNIDNAYFWRDAGGRLDCGIYDFGGFGSSCLGHKLYWIFNCSDFEQFRDNLDDYLRTFIDTYRTDGGPHIDVEVLRMQVILTALENLQFMVLAVPNCFKMCAAKEWATIKDRHDPRISENVDGKSTLRTTLHCLGNGVRILEELRADEVLESWVREVYVGAWGQEAKTDAIIRGLPA